MIELTLAALVFVASHIGLCHGAVRARLVRRLGLWPYRIVYSVISLALLNWLLSAYGKAPFVALFDPVIKLQHMSLTLVLLASLLVIGGYTIANPSAAGMEGIKPRPDVPAILRITRAPVMWGVGIFAFSHMLANPDLAAVIFFGSLMVLAIAGGWHLDRRKQAEGGEYWRRLVEQTSFLPFAAIFARRASLGWRDISWWRTALALALYGGLLAAHETLVGAGPFPLPD